MAALIRHCTMGYSLINKKNIFLNGITGGVYHDVVRHKSLKNMMKKKKPDFKSKWEWDEKSLSSRGFLRPAKPYTPTGNISERLNKVCECNDISREDSTVINNFHDRYKLFVACEKEFNYSIPNSILHKIETIGDLKTFYQTPVNTTLPLDSAIKLELPKNLHIQMQYIRFHPETDTKFNGKTAFPKSSTLVSGPKYRKMYRSFIQQNPFQ